MTINSAYVYLLSNAWTAGLMGQQVGDRVYPMELPKDPTYPCVLYLTDGGRRGYTQDGPDGVVSHLGSIVFYAETVDQLDELKRALVADWREGGVSGWRGVIPNLDPSSPLAPGYAVQGVFVTNEIDSAEAGLEATGPRVKTKTFDVLIWAEDF